LSSKTRKKARRVHELQALGVALVELPETQLKSMALADDRAGGRAEAKRIKEPRGQTSADASTSVA